MLAKYTPCDYFMVRTPLLSINDYENMFSELETINERLIDSFNSPLLRESIIVASRDLVDALERVDLTKPSKSLEQLKSSLIKYFIRLSTRPTPFGLFSGISIGRFGELSKIMISDSSQHIKRARPDMEWIYGIIKKAESDTDIRNKLRVRFNDFTLINGNRLEKPEKTLLQHGETNENLHEATYTPAF